MAAELPRKQIHVAKSEDHLLDLHFLVTYFETMISCICPLVAATVCAIILFCVYILHTVCIMYYSVLHEKVYCFIFTVTLASVDQFLADHTTLLAWWCSG